MNESSDSEINKDVNESKFFEENHLYILGKTFKKSLSGINEEFEKLEIFIYKRRIYQYRKWSFNRWYKNK